MRSLFSRFQGWKQASLLRRTVVTVATFVLLACASIAFMSYAALAATQAIFKAPPAGASASASPSGVARARASAGDVDEADDASTSAKLPTKTAATPQKGAVRTKAKPTAGDDD